jgi:hypothetical protein
VGSPTLALGDFATMVLPSHWRHTSCLPSDPLNFPVMMLSLACAIKFRIRSLKKIVSYDRCRGEDLRVRTPANPVRTPRQGSTKRIYLLRELFFKKCGRCLTKRGTVSYKTWDECEFLLGFSSLPPRLRLDSPRNPRSQ